MQVQPAVCSVSVTTPTPGTAATPRQLQRPVPATLLRQESGTQGPRTALRDSREPKVLSGPGAPGRPRCCVCPGTQPSLWTGTKALPATCPDHGQGDPWGSSEYLLKV